MTSTYSAPWCQAQDQSDPLRAKRECFDLPEGVIYLDGNSLGVLPKGVKERIQEVITQEWGTDLINSWNSADWVNISSRVGNKIAPLIGAKQSEVVATDSTSINLFKTIGAALKLNKDRKIIISEPGNFPTDLYMMQGLVNHIEGNRELKVIDRNQILDALDESVAVLVLTHVHYVTAEMFDMKAITKAAQDKGIVVVWDLSHSVGAVNVDLNDCHADFAVGCGYKYLNGGPGAPAFLFVAERHQQIAENPLSGWFGHKAPFEFVDDYAPADDIRRMLTGTPQVLALSALEQSLEVWGDVDMNELRKKSLALTEMFITLVEERLSDYNLKIVTPKDSSQRGSHVSISSENGYAIVRALIDHGVVGDFRAPNYMRFGFTPLYLSYSDILKTVDILEDILINKTWDNAKYLKMEAVT